MAWMYLIFIYIIMFFIIKLHIKNKELLEVRKKYVFSKMGAYISNRDDIYLARYEYPQPYEIRSAKHYLKKLGYFNDCGGDVTFSLELRGAISKWACGEGADATDYRPVYFEAIMKRSDTLGDENRYKFVFDPNEMREEFSEEDIAFFKKFGGSFSLYHPKIQHDSLIRN